MAILTVAEMKKAHKVLAEFPYEKGLVNKGYTGRTLYVNVGENKIESRPVSEKMKETFIGGRGFGLWLLWNAVKDTTKWNDPENEIIISSGPIGGITTYPGSGKSLVVSISPITHIPIDSNVGGYFGPLLKFSGFDAIELQGKASSEVIVVIDGKEGKVTIEEAPLEEVNSHILGEQLTEMYADDEQDKRSISVVSAGKGAEGTLIGCLNFSFYDVNRKYVRYKQAGRGGIGTVFRDKKIKALVVKYPGVKGDSNHPADWKRIASAGARLHKEIHDYDKYQCNMRTVGTPYLVTIMNDYDLLPVRNFRYGSDPEAKHLAGPNWTARYTLGKHDGCWYGCTLACSKTVDNFELKSGPYKGHKVAVDGAEYETVAGVGSNCGIFDVDYVLENNFYCDTYGIDTISFGTICGFLMDCYENGILTKEITGGLELRFGTIGAALELLHQMGRGEGFGKIAGLGIRNLKKLFVEKYGADGKFLQDIGMECKGLEYSQYLSKESLAQQGGYGLTNKGPQHDEAWLIFMDMVNNQLPTFEDKAEALYYFPMFRTWFGLNGLCKLPWNDISPADNKTTDEPHKVPEHVQNYVDIFSAVTGREITKQDIITMSEGVYNFQRVFNLRLGYGRREHDTIPYRSVGPVTVEEYESRASRYDEQIKEKAGVDPAGKSTGEKMKILRAYREEQYEKLIDAVYRRRGWSPRGVPTIETLKRLHIDYPDVVELVRKHL
ncbi:MAG: aldehyde ferredoxin oxidoreductase C-terminal domain-containing protein [Candidatus Eremiobacteraeota bacterium]|nr:aldehyde ferredoxin oxidoreductase C-terminal domain-containing protein [Candidatus Eremiobacteraeota bacterium]